MFPGDLYIIQKRYIYTVKYYIMLKHNSEAHSVAIIKAVMMVTHSK